MIDVHSHIHDSSFDEDRAEVLDRASRAGVQWILAMGEGEEDNRRVLDVAAAHREVLPCLGLHPDRAGEEDLEAVEAQIRAHAQDLAAVGEVGLDYWVARDAEADQRPIQQRVLRRMVALCRETGVPLSVHSRSAGHHTVSLLEEAGAPAGLVCLHAFDGSAKHAVRAAELGYLLSIPATVVRSPQKQKVVRRLPLESLMLETDSPVLAPEKGARNEPHNVLLAAQTIAEIKGVTTAEVARVTSENARRVFNIPG